VLNDSMIFVTGHLCVDALSTAVTASRPSEPVSAVEGTSYTPRKPVDASGQKSIGLDC